MQNDRFVNMKNGLMNSIFTDAETGVQYLLVSYGYDNCSITVLVDKDGKPLIDPKYAK
ncbi:MAG: DUF6440 family protein [Oscillospiraceae bacterium]|nr:DUF6440 family protein [Oscillospiraceae bacterium]